MKTKKPHYWLYNTLAIIVTFAIILLSGFLSFYQRLLPLVILVLLAIRMFSFVRIHRIKKLRSYWLPIKHLEYIEVTDTSFAKDATQRIKFSRYARKNLTIVPGILALGLLLSAITAVFWPTQLLGLSYELMLLTFTIAFLTWMFFYLLGSVERFGKHIIFSYFFIQFFVAMVLFVLFYVNGLLNDFISLNTFVTTYIISNILVFLLYIYVVPFYRLRFLANFTSAVNAMITVLLFFGTLFGNKLSNYLSKQFQNMQLGNRDNLQYLLNQEFFPTVRTIVTMISIVFLISGSILTIYVSIKRLNSEKLLEQLLDQDPNSYDAETYNSLQQVIYWGSRTNNLFLKSSAHLYDFAKKYEQTRSPNLETLSDE